MIQIDLRAGVDNAHQRFSQRIDERLIHFEIDYVTYLKKPYWSMNILIDGAPIACGVPLNAGGDLLANMNIPWFGRLIFVGEEATLDNLGISNNLVWVASE